MRRGHLHRPGTKLTVHQDGIRDYGDLSIQKWVLYFLVVQVQVTGIVRVHGDRSITQHCLRARRGDDQFGGSERSIRVHHWISELVELSLHIFVTFDFQIAQNRLRTHVPIHKARRSINQPLLI